MSVGFRHVNIFKFQLEEKKSDGSSVIQQPISSLHQPEKHQVSEELCVSFNNPVKTRPKETNSSLKNLYKFLFISLFQVNDVENNSRVISQDDNVEDAIAGMKKAS